MGCRQHEASPLNPFLHTRIGCPPHTSISSNFIELFSDYRHLSCSLKKKKKPQTFNNANFQIYEAEVLSVNLKLTFCFSKHTKINKSVIKNYVFNYLNITCCDKEKKEDIIIEGLFVCIF